MDKAHLFEFDDAKISAFRKYAAINPDEFKNVTIGPNSIYKNVYSDLTARGTISHSHHANNKQDGKSPKHPQEMSYTLGRKLESKVTTLRIDKEDEGLPIREIIKDLETERLGSIQSSIQKRLDRFNKHSESLENEAQQRLLYQQQKLIQNVRQEEQKIVNMLVQVEASKAAEHEKLTKYYQNLAEQRNRNAAELAAKEKLRQELNMNINQTIWIHKEFTNTYIEIINCIKASQANDELKMSLAGGIKQIKALFADMEEVTAKCKTSKYSSSDVERAYDILTKIGTLKDRIQAIVNAFINKKDEAANPKADLQQTNVKTETVNVKVNQPTAVQKGNAKVISHISLDKYVSRENLQMYTDSIDFLNKYVESFRELSESPNLKQFRFDCKKAVNIPVNAISAVNPHHLRDKYDRLYNLLAGKQIKIADNTYLTASKHPQGIAFCVDLLAKKMVLQADLMISSNADSAFCYATIIVALWNTVPDFGKLFLGYLYKGCPFLVPFNIPKAADQSPEEFYENQGYQYTDGQIEKQDKYLKRMTGLMRLYAAVIITKPKSGQIHPHGIENGWRWLASILKLEPRLDITATMLHTFLEVAGYHMLVVYKKSFKKLVEMIISKFMPVLKQNDSGGPVTRLEVLLQEYQETRQFQKPTGTLPDNFW